MRTLNYFSPFDALESVFDSAGYRTATDSYVEENKENYLIQLDVPGFTKEDVKISLDGRNLLIEGERKGPREAKIRKIFSLPEDVDFDRIVAHQKDGVLEVAVPKREKYIPKQIPIQESKGSFFKKSEDAKNAIEHNCCK